MSENWQDAEKAAWATFTKWNLKQARVSQREPRGDWDVWLILAGRGWGKTRTGAEDISSYAMANQNVITGVIAPTGGDLRRVCFEGPSGLMNILPRECITSYNKSSMEIKLWNGSKIQGYAAIEPDRLRGPQFHRIWADELAAWRYPETYDQMLFGLRLGTKPRLVVTTTPRPTPLIIDLARRDGEDVFVTKGSTFENYENLADSALALLKEKYEGTRLGRQELYADILQDVEGALWSYGMIEATRLSEDELPEMSRVVVGIDPAVTSGQNSDETGIVVAARGIDDRFYILEDCSLRATPDGWARKAVDAYYMHNADKVIAEVNNGGDLVERLLRTIDSNVPYKKVTATRGKLVRAEPIAALYEQKRVSHVGNFDILENQMCEFNGDGKSPDRMDALVWALTELSKSSGQATWRIS